MGKADRYAKQAAALAKQGNVVSSNKKPAPIPQKPEVKLIALKVGDHQFPLFENHVFNDANLRDYPAYDKIPQEFNSHANRWKLRAARIFYSGASLQELGLRYKKPADIPYETYYMSVKVTLYALLRSFAPQHEHKMATVAWCMSEWFEETE